ncbi:hypothetical protein Ae201684P_011070 [Aphanomyces euteiches]|uniref:Rab-GAP TBC domain-containing protein n=1 Tax=Aphanomyces euteiches TaxID=100861 RepID=A0A6G0XYU8_9STRA|nr:hypothetical protein Ae201684_000155 [Aphanomyces euteiches]KAH9091525.1 hypothetical protein Ae201684P_011070 [Aphanomyces euteiches]
MSTSMMPSFSNEKIHEATLLDDVEETKEDADRDIAPSIGSENSTEQVPESLTATEILPHRDEIQATTDPADAEVAEEKTSLHDQTDEDGMEEEETMNETSYLRKSIDVHDIDVPISQEDLLRSLEAELDKRRPDTYIITQLCHDLGEIPGKWRGRVWKELLCPGGIKAELQWETISMMEQDDSNQRVIRADAPRTRSKDFPSDSRETIERSLVQMLTFYCKSKNIRYKQGMNEVLAPFLLLRMASPEWTDSIVYQCFYTFIDKFLTNVYSDREFRSLQCSMRLLRLLLQYHDPVLCTLMILFHFKPRS